MCRAWCFNPLLITFRTNFHLLNTKISNFFQSTKQKSNYFLFVFVPRLRQYKGNYIYSICKQFNKNIYNL